MWIHLWLSILHKQVFHNEIGFAFSNYTYSNRLQKKKDFSWYDFENYRESAVGNYELDRTSASLHGMNILGFREKRLLIVNAIFYSTHNLVFIKSFY